MKRYKLELGPGDDAWMVEDSSDMFDRDSCFFDGRIYLDEDDIKPLLDAAREWWAERCTVDHVDDMTHTPLSEVCAKLFDEEPTTEHMIKMLEAQDHE